MDESVQKILIVLLILLLVWRWNGCTSILEPKDTVVETYTDTTYVTHIDTVEFIHDTTITKTVLVYTEIDTNTIDSSSIYTFENFVNDSLIKGSISTEIAVKDNKALFLDQSINYTPKFPKYIYQKDSIFIKDSTVVTHYENKMHLLLGANVMFSDQLGSAAPMIGVQFRNKTIVEAGYNPFNNEFIVGTKFKLKLNRKNGSRSGIK